jgi:hypothetical protein
MAVPTIALQYLIPVPILMVISSALCVVRIWTRFRARKMHLDDYLIIIAEVLALTNFGLSCSSFARGWGHPSSSFTLAEKTAILKVRFAASAIWIPTLCFVRLSIASSLLRFGHEKLWRGVLYALMTLQTLISTAYFIMQFTQCQPVSINWQNVPGAKCWPMKPLKTYAWIVSGIFVAMDFTLALMPIRFIRTLNRPRTEKLLIGILMATGLLATGVLCAKLTTVKTIGKGDPMKASIRVVMWTKMEEQVGIIASCLPTVKRLAERVLRRFSLMTTRFHNTRPSFVNPDVMEMPQTPKDHGSSNDGSWHLDKDNRRSESGTPNSKFEKHEGGTEDV